MSKLIVLASLMAGCAGAPDSPVVHLADLPSPYVIGLSTGFSIEYDHSVNCFELASNVTATVDGKAITDVGRGGWYYINASAGSECNGIAFNFPTALDTNELTSIAITDDTTTWNIDVTGLAPSFWTVQTPAAVAEDNDVTVVLAPTLPGVAIDEIYIAPGGVGISPFSAQPTNNTVHIDKGYWSEFEAIPAGTLQGTIAIELTLPAPRCSGPQRCAFTTRTPNPENAVSIVVP